MKRLLLLLILSLLLAACGGEEETAATAEDGNVSQFQIVVAADDFETGTPRIPFVIYDGPQVAQGIASVQVAAFDLSREEPEVTWTGTATGYTDYQVPYWTVQPELPTAGTWGLAAIVTTEDGAQSQSDFAVQLAGETRGPDIGTTPPASENRTLETVPDLELLTTDTDPLPALYEMTIAEAMANDLPTVVTFATPAFCQTAICTPVVNSVEEVQKVYGERANFIHVEVYKEFDPLVPADEMAEWGLGSEPWTFVLDADDTVRYRMAGPVSPVELSDALETVLQ